MSAPDVVQPSALENPTGGLALWAGAVSRTTTVLTQTVSASTTTIAWSQPASIVYGTKLSAAQYAWIIVRRLSSHEVAAVPPITAELAVQPAEQPLERTA